MPWTEKGRTARESAKERALSPSYDVARGLQYRLPRRFRRLHQLFETVPICRTRRRIATDLGLGDTSVADGTCMCFLASGSRDALIRVLFLPMELLDSHSSEAQGHREVLLRRGICHLRTYHKVVSWHYSFFTVRPLASFLVHSCWLPLHEVLDVLGWSSRQALLLIWTQDAGISSSSRR